MVNINPDYNVVKKVSLRYAKMSARKARYLADAIRGKTVKEAKTILKFSNRPSAGPAMADLLKSAVASIENERSYEGDIDNLIVSVFADDGPIMKRIQPRAFGRAYPIRKRSCHITIALCE